MRQWVFPLSSGGGGAAPVSARREAGMDQAGPPFASVTIFGGATLDRIARSKYPPVMGASNPGTTRIVPGGVGFNVATVLARLGLPTRLVTAVGADDDGDTVLAAATAAGIEVDKAIVSRSAPTASYTATLDQDGNLVIGIADMTVCDEIAPAAVAPATDASRRGFWIVDANLPPATLAFLTAEARDARVPIAAMTVSPAKTTRLIPLLDRLTYLFTNRREAAALLDREPSQSSASVAALARELTGTRTTRVIVTNGSEPLAVASRAEARSHAALKATVKAVNGAGDSFAAGTIYGLSAGYSLNEAVRFGRAAAALTLEAGGIAEAAFTRDALAERLATHSQRTAS
jgi:pseudouridine kinase